MDSELLAQEIISWVTDKYPVMKGKDHIITEIVKRVEFELSNNELAIKYNLLEAEYV